MDISIAANSRENMLTFAITPVAETDVMPLYAPKTPHEYGSAEDGVNEVILGTWAFTDPTHTLNYASADQEYIGPFTAILWLKPVTLDHRRGACATDGRCGEGLNILSWQGRELSIHKINSRAKQLEV